MTPYRRINSPRLMISHYSLLTFLVAASLIFNISDPIITQYTGVGVSSFLYMFVTIYALRLNASVNLNLVYFFISIFLYLVLITFFSLDTSVPFRVLNLFIWALFLLSIGALKNNFNPLKALKIFVQCSFFVVVYFLISGDYSYYRLSYTEEFNPTWLAYQLVLLIFTVFFLKRYSIRLKLLISTPFIVALILTQGKTALLGMIVSYIGVFILRSKYKLIMVLFLALLLPVIFFSLESYLTESEYFIWYGNLFSGSLDVILSGRLGIWEESLSAYYENFLFVPLGVLSTMDALNVSNGAHNVFLTLTYELGFYFTIAYVAFFIFLVLYSNKKHKSITPAALALFLFISGIGNDVVYYKYFWLGLTVLYLLMISDEKNKNNYR